MIFESENISFEQIITGENADGTPACSAMIMMGDPSGAPVEYDIGPVYFSAKALGVFYVVDLKFQEGSAMSFRQVYEILENYAKYYNYTNGDFDMDHFVSFVFSENSEYQSGILVAQSPLFFAQTSDVFMGTMNSMRIAFPLETLSFVSLSEDFLPEDNT